MDKKQVIGFGYFFVSLIIIFLVQIFYILDMEVHFLFQPLSILYIISLLVLVFSSLFLWLSFSAKKRYIIFGVLFLLFGSLTLVLSIEIFFVSLFMLFISFVMFKKYRIIRKNERECTEEIIADVIDVKTEDNTVRTGEISSNSYNLIYYVSTDYKIKYLDNVKSVIHSNDLDGFIFFEKGDRIKIKYNLKNPKQFIFVSKE